MSFQRTHTIRVMSRPPRYYLAGTCLVLVVGFALRVWNLGRASLWTDEFYSDLWIKASLGDFVNLLQEIGLHVPLHYLLMRLFPVGSETMLRLPSALEGLIGIALVIGVAVRLYGNYDLALGIGALTAVNPLHVWYSRTARPYALLFLLALLSSYFFLELLKGNRSRLNWAGFTLANMALYMTHYFGIMLPLAQYVLFAFIVRGYRGFFRRWIVSQVVAGIPLLVWLIVMMRRDVVAVGIGWIPRPGLDDIGITLWNMTVGYDGSLPWTIVPGLIAAGISLGMGIVYTVRSRRSDRVGFYWFWLLAAPLLVTFLLSIFWKPAYVDRYFIVFLPAVLFLMLHGWQHVTNRTAALALALAVIIVPLVVTVVMFERGFDERENWRAAAQTIEGARQSDDGLLVESPQELMALFYYLDSDSKHDFAWLFDGVEKNEQSAIVYDAPVRRVWAVYRNPIDDGHRQGIMPDFDPFEDSSSMMPNWLNAHRDQIMLQKNFAGVKVFLVDTGSEFLGAGD